MTAAENVIKSMVGVREVANNWQRVQIHKRHVTLNRTHVSHLYLASIPHFYSYMPPVGLSHYAVQQLFVGCLVGCVIGIAFGELLSKRNSLWIPLIGLTRFVAWGTVFTLWSIPVIRSFVIWRNAVYPAILFITITFVSVAVIRIHVVARAICKYPFKEAARYSTQASILHAILVWLLSQVMMSGAGWQWFAGGRYGIQAVLIVMTMVMISRLITKKDLSMLSVLYARGFIAELYDNVYDFLRDAISLILVFMVLWQLAMIIQLPTILNSPSTIIRSAVGGFFSPFVWRATLWSHVELLFGLLLNIIGGMVLSFVSRRSRLPSFSMFHFLSYSFPSLLILTTVPTSWFISYGLLPKVVAISAISFPIYFCQFHNQSFFVGVLRGLEQCLPFAFCGMLFAESMAGVNGLGFAIVQSTISAQASYVGTSMVLFVTALLVLYSICLTIVLRYQTFPPKPS